MRALLLLLSTLLLAGCGGGAPKRAAVPDRTPVAVPQTEAALDARPNFVFVLVDDMEASLIEHLPAVQELARDGTSFSRYIVSDSLCCPSRASILTGMYPHNHGVFSNVQPRGGALGFRRRGNSLLTLARPLLLRGYRTALMGKYLNGYDARVGKVPPFWTDWAASGKAYNGYDYGLSINGTSVQFGDQPDDYVTDVLNARARALIADADARRQPFFLEVAPFAPHTPAIPAPRDLLSTITERARRGPAFNRRNRDAAPWLDRPEPLSQDQIGHIDGQYRRRAASLGAVDDLVSSIRGELLARGLADNTYVVFSSDNGYHMGQHRLTPGKKTAFDSDVRVPLVIAGPGVPAGRVVSQLTQNTDLAPTFVDLAGARPMPWADGRSLAPLLQGAAPADWRGAALVEHRRVRENLLDPDVQPSSAGNPPSYAALRLPEATYVEYVTGRREYYDLRRDPQQRDNRYGTLGRQRRVLLHRRLEQLRGCAGAEQCATDGGRAR